MQWLAHHRKESSVVTSWIRELRAVGEPYQKPRENAGN
jgi:hypothetical protein